MNRNMTSLARDRRTARPVFRSFLDGIVLLAFTALLLTVQVTPVDELAATTAGNEPQPVKASLLPSIMPTEEHAPAVGQSDDGATATACSRMEKLELEILQDDSEALVIVVRRGDGSTADIIPTVVRPAV